MMEMEGGRRKRVREGKRQVTDHVCYPRYSNGIYENGGNNVHRLPDPVLSRSSHASHPTPLPDE